MRIRRWGARGEVAKALCTRHLSSLLPSPADSMPRKKAPAAVSAATLAEEETLGIEAYELPKSIGTRRVPLPSPPIGRAHV